MECEDESQSARAPPCPGSDNLGHCEERGHTGGRLISISSDLLTPLSSLLPPPSSLSPTYLTSQIIDRLQQTAVLPCWSLLVLGGPWWSPTQIFTCQTC